MGLLLALVAATAAGRGAAIAATPRAPEAVNGERLATRHCASCHALGPAMPSPLEDAPNFPELRARYSSSAMASILERRMVEIHPRMPLLDLGPDELNAFLAYWETLQPAERRQIASPELVGTGGRIVTRDCGGCHAVGKTGQSAFSSAPPFRVLGSRYDIEGLSEALAEGISVGHPTMPERAYPAAEVAAIVAYLKSIQPVRGRP